MFCVKCGKEIENGYSFCPNCGAACQGNAAPVTDSVSQPSEKMVTGKHIPKKGILISVIVIILILVGVFFLLGKSSDSDRAAEKISEPAKLEVVGKWTTSNDTSNVYILINEDHTGEMESGGWAVKFTWKYTESNHKLNLDFEMMDLPGKLTYNPKDDTLIFTDGDVLRRVS